MPIIATSVPAEQESLLLEAGVDRVLELPFNCDRLKMVVREALNLSEWVEPAAAEPWSLASALMRGFHRLTQA